MRIEPAGLREVLAEAWERWAVRCGELTGSQWRAATRCGTWEVQGLVAHVCPEVGTFDALAEAIVAEPPAVTDAADMLRMFNEPDGVANTTADQIAERAVAEAPTLTPGLAAGRFTESAARLRSMPAMSTPQETVIRYPIVGSTTLAVVAEVALMEATVHLLDLADAVGGVAPSTRAVAATRDLLVAIPDPVATIEVLAGRRDPDAAFPAIR
ncbi:maleylpyruvate isomerase N-terminal domain-containing protein [Mycobacterium sp. 21AC1]|uniref:maleylpyruvate isomerase N-terminal domain-containing protein n=1 Tax=[Mycobacterium] appelbergii TaxID=2939269 RepID=UPI00293953F5|nr:maleylpyruvate isomerase N-terminal domain-containing protein [Mycobacterium sp. 21AC1]MDV3124944.1 maleylpyruvate isomerase N-terminal domain-containing protein [Mycobacterium sp. 21AC1]